MKSTTFGEKPAFDATHFVAIFLSENCGLVSSLRAPTEACKHV
ncbi:hypothetical protein MIZ03_1236 [Rhodoferax lithotrophicus]|uniref:Uncharacterized protein n=1 Tax=Rhodoferax lithotrophicus TaxID=2798804 RepID=A0ABN6D6D1_9BURK|nr:hypothetical protein MIZ03_1236 [Rhodoferax sp. MIZ03]